MQNKIQSLFPDETDKNLINQICDRRGSKHVLVSEFQRFGFSNSKLFLVFFSDKPFDLKEPKGMPFLIKKSPIADAKNEFKALGIMKDYVRDANTPLESIVEFGDWGAILYNHLGSNVYKGSEAPTTLKDMLFCQEDEFPVTELKECCDTVFELMINAHVKIEKKIIDPKNNLEYYYRDNRSNPIIKLALDKNSTKKEFVFVDEQIYNPLIYLDEIPDKVDSHTSFVHGDLHPDNVVLNKRNEVHLIDFSWSSEDKIDVLVDFVLLENSIRFWHFPRSSNLDEQLKVDRLLLLKDGYSEIEKLEFSCLESKRCFARMSSAIGSIRNCAENLLGKEFDFDHYLLVQFIVLYGLMSYDTYDRCSGIRALGMIAKELKDR